MAFPVWQSNQVGASGSATPVTSRTITKPVGTVQGDLLLLVATWFGSPGTLTPPAGFTEAIAPTITGTISSGVWYRFAGASEPASYAFSWSTSCGVLITLSRITGAYAVTDISHNFSASSTTAAAAPSLTLPSDDYLILQVGGSRSQCSFASASSMTERYDATNTNGPGGFIYTLDFTGTTTGTKTVTVTPSSAWTTYLVAVAPPPTGGPLDLGVELGLSMEGNAPHIDIPVAFGLDIEGHPGSGAENINLGVELALQIEGQQTGPEILHALLNPIVQEHSVTIDAEADPPDTFLVEEDPPDETEPPPEAGEPLLPSRTLHIQRMIREAPTPVLDSKGRPVDWDLGQPTFADWGRLKVVCGGQDVTFYRNVPTEVLGWEKGEPFGDRTARILFPQITGFDAIPSFLGDPDGLGTYARVDIYQRHPDGTKDKLWEGITAAFSEQDGGLLVECMGQMYQGDLFLRRARLTEDLEATDIGTILSDLVTPYGRDRKSWQIRPLPKKTTGVKVLSTGSWQPLMNYVAELLGQAQTDSGQWTMRMNVGRKPALLLKDTTTEHYSICYGEQGVTCDLRLDLSQAPTTVFGEGVSKNNAKWYNARYPNLRMDDPPAFFGTPITPGSTAHHDSMLLFEREMEPKGYPFDEDGNYDVSEEFWVSLFQTVAGITVDGIIGPQTWAAAFEVGSGSGDLDNPFIHSLYSKRVTEAFNRDANGAKTTANPTFDPKVLRNERYENFGSQISKKEGITSAGIEVERDWPASWFGTITLDGIDPPEKSRLELLEGRNIMLRAFRGQDILFHIAHVSVSFPDVVTLTVDTKARDWMTLGQMLERDRSSTDPMRRREVHRYNRSSKEAEDRLPQFDSEATGRIPYHAIQPGAWNVLRIPAGKVGTIVRTRFETEWPTQMAVGIFQQPVDAAFLLGVGSGDPLAHSDYWEQFGDKLLNAWGSKPKPGGWYPWEGPDDEPDEDAIDQTPPEMTGVLVDEGSWNYESLRPPWLWVAIWVDTAGPPGYNYVKGRLYQSNATT